MCLDRKKAVLCEKALALNSGQVKEMIDKARREKVFLMEALWTKFLPHYQKLQEMLAEKKLGDIRSMLVNFGFIPQPPVPPRLLDPALGGGTMLDIGIYNVFMTLSVLGRPDEIEASMTPASTGIDEQCAVLFKYRNGALAQLFSSFLFQPRHRSRYQRKQKPDQANHPLLRTLHHYRILPRKNRQQANHSLSKRARRRLPVRSAPCR
jgi:predicted dehydrogenase